MTALQYMCACCTESVSVQTVVSDHSVGVCLFVALCLFLYRPLSVIIQYTCACCTETVSVQTLLSERSVGVGVFHCVCFCTDYSQWVFSMCVCCTVSVSVQTILSEHSVCVFVVPCLFLYRPFSVSIQYVCLLHCLFLYRPFLVNVQYIYMYVCCTVSVSVQIILSELVVLDGGYRLQSLRCYQVSLHSDPFRYWQNKKADALWNSWMNVFLTSEPPKGAIYAIFLIIRMCTKMRERERKKRGYI